MARLSNAETWLTEEGLKLIRHWKANDMKEADIAKKMGIGASTLSDWKGRHPEIAEALKKGLEDCIADAEEALFSKFKPYTYDEVRKEEWRVDSGKVGKNGEAVMKVREQHIVSTKKTVMPDTAAIIFFLKAKGGWRENSEIVDNSQVKKIAETLETVGTIQ